MDESEKINQFMETTKATEAQAKFFLQAHNWDLEEAFNGYFEADGDDKLSDSEEYRSVEGEPSTWQPSSPPQTMTGQAPRSTRPQQRIATLAGMRSDDEEDSDKEKQQYFAGGGDHSGQLIEGSGRPMGPNEYVRALFDKAKRAGPPPEEPESEGQSASFKAFTGQGNRLGEDEGPSESVGVPLNQRDNMDGAARGPTVIELTFWRNGFTVNDGELRLYDDSRNNAFLASINNGLVPLELMQGISPNESGRGVEMKLRDCKSEDYVAQKKPLAAFSGSGQRLGSPAPTVRAHQSTAMGSPALVSSPPTLEVNPAEPITTVQVRLADGKRLSVKMNHNQTVGDLRNHVRHVSSRPGDFVLMTTFPRKELTDDLETVENAKLLNAVVIQKMA